MDRETLRLLEIPAPHGNPQSPADDRHGGLEKAEGQRHAEIVADINPAQRGARGNGYGKRVHGKGYGNGKRREEGHGETPEYGLGALYIEN